MFPEVLTQTFSVYCLFKSSFTSPSCPQLPHRPRGFFFSFVVCIHLFSVHRNTSCMWEVLLWGSHLGERFYGGHNFFIFLCLFSDYNIKDVLHTAAKQPSGKRKSLCIKAMTERKLKDWIIVCFLWKDTSSHIVLKCPLLKSKHFFFSFLPNNYPWNKEWLIRRTLSWYFEALRIRKINQVNAK